jgi:hypothetical protein
MAYSQYIRSAVAIWGTEYSRDTTEWQEYRASGIRLSSMYYLTD